MLTMDSTDRLTDALENFGVPEKLIRLVYMTLMNSRSKVLVGGREGKVFNITRGVRQGDTLSALLFNLALHKAVGKIDLKRNIISKLRQAHANADGIALS